MMIADKRKVPASHYDNAARVITEWRTKGPAEPVQCGCGWIIQLSVNRNEPLLSQMATKIK